MRDHDPDRSLLRPLGPLLNFRRPGNSATSHLPRRHVLVAGTLCPQSWALANLRAFCKQGGRRVYSATVRRPGFYREREHMTSLPLCLLCAQRLGSDTNWPPKQAGSQSPGLSLLISKVGMNILSTSGPGGVPCSLTR